MSSHGFTIIDRPSWEKAHWYDFGFLREPNSTKSPILFLLFRDIEAGIGIFSVWRELLGEDDAKNILRITIAEGIHLRKGTGYALGFSVNSENIPLASAGDAVSTDTFSKFKTAENMAALQDFKKECKLHRRFRLAPATYSKIANKYSIQGEFTLNKPSPSFRTFDSIHPDEQECIMFDCGTDGRINR